MEQKLYPENLKDALGIFSRSRRDEQQDAAGTTRKHKIKLAFISACQSEEIGKIFSKAGIPIVIAVNAGQSIKDSACARFSSIFYSYLLRDYSVRDAFNAAKDGVRAVGTESDACCCAHSHDDSCLWYQFYKKDPQAAHEIHTKDKCSCNLFTSTKVKEHKKNCQALIKFKQFMLKEKREMRRKQKEAKKRRKTSPSGMAPASQLLLALDFDEDSDVQGDSDLEFEQEILKEYNCE